MFSWGRGPHTVNHCDKVVQLLLTGRDYKVLTPQDMAIKDTSKIKKENPMGSDCDHHQVCLSVWKSLKGRISYAFDHHIDSLVPHEGDLWLHPDDAWSIELGDCDDHATLFTEWSRSLGVLSYTYMGWVMGRSERDSYHAWSVSVINEKEFIVDAVYDADDRLGLFYNGLERGEWKYEIDPGALRFSSAGIQIWENESWRFDLLLEKQQFPGFTG